MAWARAQRAVALGFGWLTAAVRDAFLLLPPPGLVGPAAPAFKSALNEQPIPEAQALLAECVAVGLVEHGTSSGASTRQPVASTGPAAFHEARQMTPMENALIAGAFVALVAAVYLGASWLPAVGGGSGWVEVARTLLRPLVRL